MSAGMVEERRLGRPDVPPHTTWPGSPPSASEPGTLATAAELVNFPFTGPSLSRDLVVASPDGSDIVRLRVSLAQGSGGAGDRPLVGYDSSRALRVEITSPPGGGALVRLAFALPAGGRASDVLPAARLVAAGTPPNSVQITKPGEVPEQRQGRAGHPPGVRRRGPAGALAGVRCGARAPGRPAATDRMTRDAVRQVGRALALLHGKVAVEEWGRVTFSLPPEAVTDRPDAPLVGRWTYADEAVVTLGGERVLLAVAEHVLRAARIDQTSVKPSSFDPSQVETTLLPDPASPLMETRLVEPESSLARRLAELGQPLPGRAFDYQSVGAGSELPDPRPPASFARSRARLAAIAQLERGWLEGEGEPVTTAARARTGALLDAVEPAGLPAPRLYPTEAGGVRAEWDRAGLAVSAETTEDGALLLQVTRRRSRAPATRPAILWQRAGTSRRPVHRHDDRAQHIQVISDAAGGDAAAAQAGSP